MTSETLSFHTALITGSAGGLGRAMAEDLLKRSKKVILAGRTESKLQTASQELSSLSQHGSVPYYVLDTGKVSSIPSFVKKLVSEHPDVDCLINNAGVQRPLNCLDFDLEKADQEIDINIRGPMHLAMAMLPHFLDKKHAVFMNVGSVLGFVPFSVINPVYNGTKAWVHFWSLNLRSQLQKAGKTNIKVIEIVPPTVATDLHREREDPNDNKKEKNSSALSVEEFMQDVGRGWEAGEETIGAGMAKGIVKRWDKEFGSEYNEKTG